jgi:hypothetical protein
MSVQYRSPAPHVDANADADPGASGHIAADDRSTRPQDLSALAASRTRLRTLVRELENRSLCEGRRLDLPGVVVRAGRAVTWCDGLRHAAVSRQHPEWSQEENGDRHRYEDQQHTERDAPEPCSSALSLALCLLQHGQRRPLLRRGKAFPDIMRRVRLLVRGHERRPGRAKVFTLRKAPPPRSTPWWPVAWRWVPGCHTGPP